MISSLPVTDCSEELVASWNTVGESLAVDENLKAEFIQVGIYWCWGLKFFLLSTAFFHGDVKVYAGPDMWPTTPKS